MRRKSKGAIGGIGAKLTAASGWTSLKGETDGRTGTVRAAICRAGATRTPKVQRLLTERALHYP